MEKSKPAVRRACQGNVQNIGWELLNFQNGLQIAGHSAVLQKKAGSADAAVFPNIRVNGAVLPQSQIHFQIGQAYGRIPEVDFRPGFAEPVEGIQRIGSQLRS